MIRNDNDRVRERMPDGAPLQYAPENEQGVVYLFSHWAKENGYKIEDIRPQFPDCIATKGERRLRIEFEYRSSSFRCHMRPDGRKNCDLLVCWEHNWPAKPNWLDVIELRSKFGMGLNVWVSPVAEPYATKQTTRQRWDSWTVPRNSRPGDLVFYYKTSPHREFESAWVVRGDVKSERGGDWNGGSNTFFAPIKRVCILPAPIHLVHLKQHRVLSTAGFVRGGMRGPFRITSGDWPDFYNLIIERNPSCKRHLLPYRPEQVCR